MRYFAPFQDSVSAGYLWSDQLTFILFVAWWIFSSLGVRNVEVFVKEVQKIEHRFDPRCNCSLSVQNNQTAIAMKKLISQDSWKYGTKFGLLSQTNSRFHQGNTRMGKRKSLLNSHSIYYFDIIRITCDSFTQLQCPANCIKINENIEI